MGLGLQATKTWNVIIAYPLLPGPLNRLKQIPGINILPQSAVDKVIEKSAFFEGLKDADAILTAVAHPVGETEAELASKLRCVSTISVGYDHIDVKNLKKRGIRLGHTPGVLTDAVADTALMLSLMVSRKALSAAKAGKGGDSTRNQAQLLGIQIGWPGRTAGIIGLGRIGMAIADRLSAIGFTNFVYTTSKTTTFKPIDSPITNSKPDKYGKEVALPELLKTSDLVVVACALNEDTAGIIDHSALSLMKPSAFLVNIARGRIIDTDDLVNVLRNKTIAGAGLDVTYPEPLPKDHPLLDESLSDCCVVLPHIASATYETREAMMNMAIDNLIAAFEDKPMAAEIN